jgi:hydrogenase maturation protease
VGEPPGRRVLVVGLGNDLRGDDGAGLAVARALRSGGAGAAIAVEEAQGEPLDLIDRFATCAAVVIVDAMRSGAEPGALLRFDASTDALPRGFERPGSTHAIALGDVLEIARALGRLPPRVVVYAVEGRCFDTGAALSGAVAAAVPGVAGAIRAEAGALAAGARAVGDSPS